jgi:toxin ParE1/3/4
MSFIVKSKDAQRDIDEISLHIAQTSVAAALRWYDDLDKSFRRIANAPGMGTAHDSIDPGLRSVAMGNYLVFFRKVRRGIEIVRVIHGARKWQRILKRM